METMVPKEALIARANQPGEYTLRLHSFYKGKMQVLPKCAVRGFEDFAVWYTPGVAAPCRAIQADPALVYAQETGLTKSRRDRSCEERRRWIDRAER